MVFEKEIQESCEKNIAKNHVLFDCLSICGRFPKAFGKGLETPGVSWSTFWRLFLALVFGTLSKRALGGSWARFLLDFEGSGEGLWLGCGKVLITLNEKSVFPGWSRQTAQKCIPRWIQDSCGRLLR